ncbi:MAG: hypothetical protein WC003_02980 [Terrimicrobiaceae bacterium]
MTTIRIPVRELHARTGHLLKYHDYVDEPGSGGVRALMVAAVSLGLARPELAAA